MLVETEEDESLIAIDADGSGELVVELNSPKVIVEGEEDEGRDLSAELEAKVEAGTASKRLERRMKRKENREAKEIFEEIAKNLPPIPAPGTPIAELPGLEGLPPLPMPSASGELPPLPLPAIPAPGELPPLPLPAIPAPERKVTCASCGAGITVKDMTLRRMPCPICSENIDM